MLQVKFCSSILSKICLLVCISGAPLGYCRESFQEETAIIHGKNFNANQIIFNYLENTKQIGLFATGTRHHIWGEFAGVTDKPFFQIGAGYRFLSKKAPLTQNSFWGVYTYLRPYDYVKYFERLGWIIGFEKANPSWQGTINFYGCYAIKGLNQFTKQYHEEKFGLSGRLSWYLMQRMTFLGRFNPFVFVAYTDAQHIKTNANPTIFFGIKNGGFGIRWEYAYFALEGQANWDSVKSGVFLKANYQLGLQIKLTDRYETRGSYPIHRLYETPQGYKPNYNMAETARAGFCSAYDEQRKKSGLPSQVMFENMMVKQPDHLDPYVLSEEEELPVMVDNEPKKPVIGASVFGSRRAHSAPRQVKENDTKGKGSKAIPVSSRQSQASPKPPATFFKQNTTASSHTSNRSTSKRPISKPKPIQTTTKQETEVEGNNGKSTVIKSDKSLQAQASSSRTPTPIRSQASKGLDEARSIESALKETKFEVNDKTDDEAFYTPTFQPEQPTPSPTKQSPSIFSSDLTPGKVGADRDTSNEVTSNRPSHSEKETDASSPSKHSASLSQRLQALVTPTHTLGMNATNQPLGTIRPKASLSGLSDAQTQPPSTRQPVDDELD